MKLFSRINLSAIGLLALAAAFVIVLPGCSTKGTTSAASAPPIPYPLDTCVVSGDKLGADMGPPIVFVYSNHGVNQQIKLCCPDCRPKFLNDPEKYMKTIREAEAAQKE